MSDYVLGHCRPEIDRLQRQAEMLRPITERLLVAAGVEPGMRVLDIGCGPGDVSTLIADLVGPTGSVVGIDPSAEALAVARERFRERDNVGFVQSDVDGYTGPADFDAAVCRYVLIHQKEPSDFLRRTSSLLRSGGLIALHEMDAARGVYSNPRLPLLHEVYDAICDTLIRPGTAFDVGGRLVGVFLDAGLPAPRVFSQTLVDSAPNSTVLSWTVDLAREVLPLTFDFGTLLDRLQRAAGESGSQIEFPPQLCAWTRV